MSINKNIKNNIINTALVAIAITLAISCSPDETQTVTTLNNLVKQDEFNIDGAPDSDMWTYDIGTGNNGWGNFELQHYTDRPENVVVEDGVLKITALQESYMGSGYTSARIKTQGLFTQQYGRFEVRMKLPWGQGVWPAFWLLGEDIDTVGWPNCGEIDVMENRGQEPTLINGSVHGPGYSGGQAVTKSFELENDRFDTDFHIFGIEWGQGYINFYVDDVLYNQVTPADVTGDWVYDKPFFIIMNLAVGGDYVGAPSAQTVFPQTLEVDYVRIYQ